MKTLRTPEQARAWLSFHGISVSQWSRENGVSHALVYEILKGKKRCLRGSSHNIAVLLGMKEGVATTRPARVTPPERHRRTSVASQAGAPA